MRIDHIEIINPIGTHSLKDVVIEGIIPSIYIIDIGKMGR